MNIKHIILGRLIYTVIFILLLPFAIFLYFLVAVFDTSYDD